MINFKFVLYCDVVFIRLLWSIMSSLNSDILVFFFSDGHVWTPFTSCVLSVSLVVHGLVFVTGLVGWKNFARLATSSCDCRTISLSGSWSTVEPNETSPLFQSWRSEIFGGGRGDMNAFSYKTSPVFRFNNFWNPISRKYHLKDNYIR